MLPILEISAWNAYCSLAIGLCLNALLIWIANKHSGTELREYRHIVFYLCILNIGLLVFQALGQPLILVDNNSVFLLLPGPITKIPCPILWPISIALFFIIFNKSAFAQALQFLNRYLIICRNFSDRFCHFLIHAVLNILIMTFVILMVVFSTPKSTTTIGDPYFRGIVVACDIDLQENFPLKIVFIYFVISFVVGNLTTVVCFLQIRAFLRANTWNVINGLNRNTITKIIRCMIVQAFVPLYTFALGGLCCTVIVTGHYISDLLKQLLLLFFVTTNWLPILNPIATILTIREYRLQVLAILRLRKSQTTTTIFALQQQPAKASTRTPNLNY